MSQVPRHFKALSSTTLLVALAVWAPAARAGPPRAADRVAPYLSALSCACFEGGELKVDRSRTLASQACTCPYAEDVRREVSESLAALSDAELRDRTQVALALEQFFVTRSPEYEELFRYDRAAYRWFLENVRCVCDGCKATVYLSNCNLGCAPSVRYKRRARIWLALGLSTDEIIDFYWREHNASVSARDQVERSWLLPRKQTRRGWVVPAMAIGGALVLLGVMLARVVRRGRRQAPQTDPPGGAGDGEAISAAERDRLLDDLEDLEQDGTW